MQVLGYVQAYGFLILYTIMFVGVPAMIFGGVFKKFRLCIRIPMYLTISNFFVIFLVQLLQILHISYGPVIWIIIIGLTLWGLIKIRKFNPFQVIQIAYYRFQVIASGAVGVKTQLLKMVRGIGSLLARIFGWIKRYLLMNPVEFITLIAIAVVLCLIMGNDVATMYGWKASDCPVHAYWINAMVDNDIFVDGIYPFGYHCIIYLFYAMFNIPIFVGIRCIALVSTVYVCVTVYAALKSVCKGAASPAIGVLLYFTWTTINYVGVIRFRDGIPQEYGMIFLLPSIMFLCEFFRLQGAYPKEKGQWKKWDDSKLMVFFMGASVSLTLSVHFYNTIAVMIMLIGAVIGGYILRVFRVRYLLPILAAGFFGFFVAVLPMGVCFALGTPLQGSLNWALGVMGIGEGVGEWEDEIVDPNEEYIPSENHKGDISFEKYTRDGVFVYDDITLESDDRYQVSVEQATEVEAEANAEDTELEEILSGKAPFSLKNFIISMKYNVALNMCYYSAYRDQYMLTWFMLLMCVAPFVFGLIILFMDKERGYAFMAYGMAALFMFGEYALCVTGTMKIMDSERSLCFLLPIFFTAISLSFDGLVQVLFGWFKKKWIMAIASTLALIGIGYFVYDSGEYRLEPISTYVYEPNGAIACTTNIIETNEKNTWTVVSAGDELHMVEHSGFHAEIIEFLYIINKVNNYSKYTIPTEKVYFYIEKNPINTGGETISKSYALEPLPNTLGQTAYYGHNRTVVMSKLMYWAREFKSKYPNEMYVYYEDDDFICYCLEQNPYSVLNLSIPYGMNEKTDVDATKILLGENGKWDDSDASHVYKDILDSYKEQR